MEDELTIRPHTTARGDTHKAMAGHTDADFMATLMKLKGHGGTFVCHRRVTKMVRFVP